MPVSPHVIATMHALVPLPPSLALVSLQLAPGVSLTAQDDGAWRLEPRRDAAIMFRLPAGPAPAAFSRLAGGNLAFTEIADRGRRAGAAGFAFLVEQLLRLWRGGLLQQAVAVDAEPGATLCGRAQMPLITGPVGADDPMALTEGACVRMSGRRVVVESVECAGAIELHHSKLSFVFAWLAAGSTSSAIAAATGLPLDAVVALVSWAAMIGAAAPRDGAEAVREELLGWSFADRLLHARSRIGRAVGDFGGTYHLRGVVPEPPAIPPARASGRLHLCAPALEDLVRHDPPLTAVVEQRRSRREHGEVPVSVAQLSEFLYRTARVKGRFVHAEVELIRRPFPSGGGLHELELYVLANRVAGLEPGLYRYEGVEHGLEPVSGVTRITQRIVADGVRASRFVGEPQVMVLLAARFRRMHWKYQSMSYAAILKNVGVVYELMYLNATAMGLAACALGAGDSDAFAEAAGTSYWQESSVGEFFLGTLPNHD